MEMSAVGYDVREHAQSVSAITAPLPQTPPAGGKHRIGILGGMGPWATYAFFGEVLEATRAASDQEHVQVVIDSDPSTPDRTAFLLGNGPDPLPGILNAARRLAKAGAELIVIPCNTANVFADEVEDTIGLPVVRWIDTAVDAVAAMSTHVVGVLATTGTVAIGVYQQALARRGLRAIVPGELTQSSLMDSIYGGVKSGRVAPVHRRKVLTAAKELCDDGAEALILGCTELPLLIPSSDPAWPCPVVDPAQVVSRAVVGLAGAEKSSERAAGRSVSSAGSWSC